MREACATCEMGYVRAIYVFLMRLFLVHIDRHKKNHPVSPGTGTGITYNSPGPIHNCSAFTKYSNIHFSGHFRNTPVPEARVPNLIP